MHAIHKYRAQTKIKQQHIVLVNKKKLKFYFINDLQKMLQQR